METIILKIIEQSITAAILVVILWIFLPRLIRTLDTSIDRSTKEHMAITLMLLNVERRMNWHEAKVYGVNPSTGANQDEQQSAATESFQKAEQALKILTHDIHELFGVPRNGPERRL